MYNSITLGKVAIIISTVAVFIAIGGLNHLAERLDGKRAAAYAAYEQCIKKQYGVSPSTYYQSLGEYPVCE